MAISTAVLGMISELAARIMPDFRLPVFRHAQWPPPGCPEGPGCCICAHCMQFGKKIVLGLRAGVATLLLDVVCLPGRFRGGLSIPS